MTLGHCGFRRRGLKVALAAAGLLAAVAFWQSHGSPGTIATQRPTAVTSAPATPGPMAAPGGDRPEAELERALFDRGSLRQTQADGGWTVNSGGRLIPSLAVRRRFDYLLSAQGEATLPEIAALLRTQAERELPPSAVTQLMVVWDAYLGLLHHAFLNNPVASDPATWQPALDERMQVRRDLLGADWAEAFYRQDEDAMRRDMALRQAVAAGQAPGDGIPDVPALPAAARMPQPGDDTAALNRQRVQQLGQDAADRLHELDLEEARWNQRIATARQRLAELQAQTELSAPQRLAEMHTYLAGNFDDTETRRVETILGLSSLPDVRQ